MSKWTANVVTIRLAVRRVPIFLEMVQLISWVGVRCGVGTRLAVFRGIGAIDFPGMDDADADRIQLRILGCIGDYAFLSGFGR
jgi:hypothetical protein